MPRPKLLKIRLIYSQEGTQIPLEIDLDPCKTTSLFFDEHAAVEILGGFYENQNRTITRDQAIARFGTRAQAWFPKGKDELPLNKAFLKRAWGDDKKKKATRGSECRMDARANADSLPMMVIKDPDCMPSGYP
jgi:hypothetical protein